MAHPLLIMKKMTDEEGFIKAIGNLVKKKPAKKKAKAKVKAKPKAKVKAKKKVEPPVRTGPFEVGDKVWYLRAAAWLPGTIKKCISPKILGKEEQAWAYEIEETSGQVTEDDILPAGIFMLLATDVVRMREAPFASPLNAVFDENVFILGAYRKGQQRPWAYYVFPDLEEIKKEEVWFYTDYGSKYDNHGVLYVRPAKDISMRLKPISSAPQEILTYLGLHVYNRKWKNYAGHLQQEDL